MKTKTSDRLRQIAGTLVNRVTAAADLNDAAALLDDCERFIRGDELRTPTTRELLLERLAGRAS